MKTTIQIAEPILEDAKKLARREGVTLRLLAEEGLRSVLGLRTDLLLPRRKASNIVYRPQAWLRVRHEPGLTGSRQADRIRVRVGGMLRQP